jgi:hypothetical protein
MARAMFRWVVTADTLGRLDHAMQPSIQLDQLLEVQRTGRLFYFS